MPGAYSSVSDSYAGNDNYSSPAAYGHRPGHLNPKDSKLLERIGQDRFSGNSIRDQVFGGQVTSQKYTLKHFSSQGGARERIHHQHIKEINRRITELSGDLSIARMLSGGRLEKDIIKLQGQMDQLEREKRKERLDFWKDMAEIGKDRLDTALEYNAVTRRADLFQGLEVGYE